MDMMWFVEAGARGLAACGASHTIMDGRKPRSSDLTQRPSRSRVEGSIEGGDDKRFNEMSRNDSVAVNSA